MLRPHNEDSFAADPRTGLAIVADGMGGHNAGEVASRMAVEIIVAGLEAAASELEGPLEPRRAEVLLKALIERANRLIHEGGRARREYTGMGTTVVVALWYDRNLSVGHVGDSRLYRLRSGRLEQLTRDHTLVQEEVERGRLTRETAREAPIRSILTRAVGSDTDVTPDLLSCETMRDDLYLLCSDGLTEMLSDSEIAAVLAAPRSRIQELVEALIQHANERGGVDNISVILVRVIGKPESGSPR
jgi:protein phosphatase